MEPIVNFETHPSRYRHWKLKIEGPAAYLTLDIQDDGGLRPGYQLKLNSYDLGVDIELADAVERLRFEHPEVKVVVIQSGKERIFSAGANIFMLASSSHSFKVNFCKFTNETRLGMEEASRESGQKYICRPQRNHLRRRIRAWRWRLTRSFSLTMETPRWHSPRLHCWRCFRGRAA